MKKLLLLTVVLSGVVVCSEELNQNTKKEMVKSSDSCWNIPTQNKRGRRRVRRSSNNEAVDLSNFVLPTRRRSEQN